MNDVDLLDDIFGPTAAPAPVATATATAPAPAPAPVKDIEAEMDEIFGPSPEARAAAASVPATIEQRREQDVDALLERAAIVREDIEDKGPEPLPPVAPEVRATADLLGITADAAAELPVPLADAVATPDLEQVRRSILELKPKMVEHYWAYSAQEALLKDKKNEFNETHADIITIAKTEKKNFEEYEGKIKQLLEIHFELTGEKMFDEHLAVKEFELIEYDAAEATTWARVHYPAALNEILNDDLVRSYIKDCPDDKRPSWATVKKEPRGQVSKKF